VGYSAYYNTTQSVSGVNEANALSLEANPFVNVAGRNLYLAAGSLAIDSSLDVLQDRDAFRVVKETVGIAASPILAPDRDLYGQLRVDDPAVAGGSSGLGLNVFKDRGAVERADFVQPTVSLVMPLDDSSSDMARQNGDHLPGIVRLERDVARGLTQFVLQLGDAGVGIDDSTVDASKFIVEYRPLVGVGAFTSLAAGSGYVFQYLENTKQVVMQSPAVFSLGEYRITVENSQATGIKDLAGNRLLNNDIGGDGSTAFSIALVDVPAAPTGVSGTVLDGAVGLQWVPPTMPTGATLTGFFVEHGTDGINWIRSSQLAANVTTYTVSGLANGTTYRFRVRGVNDSGIVSADPAETVTGLGNPSAEVQVTPLAIPTLALANDTSRTVNNTDGITKDGTVNVGRLQAGANWQFSIDSGSGVTWTAGVGSSFVLPEGTYALGTVQVRQTFPVGSGNTSQVGNNQTAFVVDQTAPSAPILALGPNVTDPVSASEAVQAAGVVTVLGEAGAAIVVTFRRGAGTPVVKNLTGTGAPQKVVLTVANRTALGDGAIDVTATQTDVAGNAQTQPAASTSFQLDTTPPASAATLELGVGVANGATRAEATQASGVVVVAGESNALIVVTFRRGAGTPITKTVTATGASQGVALTDADVTALGDGSITVTAVQTDAAGNPQTQAPATRVFTLDTTPPSAPVLALGVGVANGVTAAEATQASGVVTVRGENGATIVVAFQRGAGTPITKTLTGVGAAQPVVLSAADVAALGDGPITVTAMQTDAAGNPQTVAAATTSFTLDTTGPSAPTLALGLGVANGATAAEATQAAGVVTVMGESGATIVVTLSRGLGASVTKTILGTGAAQPVVLTSADVATLGDGTITVTAVQTDAAGNVQIVPAATTSFTLDTIAAVVTNVTSSLANGTYGTNQVVTVQVVFQEPVVVTGTPVLALNTAPQRSATYVSGSGTTTLTFSYTVLLGDASSDLNYASTGALTGGTITDLAGNAAVRTLPGLAAAGSLATNKNIIISGTLGATADGGFGTSSPGPAISTPVTRMTIRFAAPVTGVKLNALRLYYGSRQVSLRGASISGSGTTWTLVLPKSATSLRGNYRLDIGGPNSGIQSGGLAVTTVSSIYWRKV
jgi:hypothetical protein